MNRSLLNLSPAELIAIATGRRGAEAYADAHRLVEKLAREGPKFKDELDLLKFICKAGYGAALKEIL